MSINDLLVPAAVLALRDHPLVNPSCLGDEATTVFVHRRVNIGIAVASENGLVVPVLDDADQKTVAPDQPRGAPVHRAVGPTSE